MEPNIQSKPIIEWRFEYSTYNISLYNDKSLIQSILIMEKLGKLEEKYKDLLSATSKLFERTSRRHRSNKDLSRTVTYLRSLYN